MQLLTSTLLRNDLEIPIKTKITSQIREFISTNRKNLFSVFLVGSLSKGEGSATKLNDKLILLSDIDLLAIKILPHNLKFNLDVFEVPFYKIPFIKNKFETYEWHNYGKNVYGVKKINKLFQNVLPNLNEIKNIIKSRRDEFLKTTQMKVQNEEARLKKLFKINKFVFALADLKVFEINRYSASAVTKTKIMENFFPEETLTKLCRECLEFRKIPENSKLKINILIRKCEKIYKKLYPQKEGHLK